MGSSTLEPFIRKLEIGAELSAEDRQKLSQLTFQTKAIGSHEDVIKEGDRPDHVHLVLSGFACRYKVLPGGDRQILAWLVPGDMCDLHISILGEMDHTIGTLSPCQMAFIPRDIIEELTLAGGTICRALWWATLVDEAILREWLVGLGRRTADRRMAHLFCELNLRLLSVGAATRDSFDLPATQDELGDTLGLSTVHVNRTLQHLREDKFLTLTSKRLTILDRLRLEEFAEFDPNYLHLDKRPH
ncbi:Crp/Fnr family transcriptional regulator [Bradyrhizobium sp. 44]|uniref:Crp/Fnr family transcriptional regulator n=1 Tax=Bradyrhizobium sp. 44 TaxID=2782675 RepID=UPI001FFAE2E0|nr:Crp/Fnr family transcriptional regulator [Bradyrhizobium sp. 44]MCK1283883.1 Crp/Fnr family transcriptional regulator [Bradyrhizobium sp. 44]